MQNTNHSTSPSLIMQAGKKVTAEHKYIQLELCWSSHNICPLQFYPKIIITMQFKYSFLDTSYTVWECKLVIEKLSLVIDCFKIKGFKNDNFNSKHENTTAQVWIWTLANSLIANTSSAPISFIISIICFDIQIRPTSVKMCKDL